jgi:heavy metal sensor kinase
VTHRLRRALRHLWTIRARLTLWYVGLLMLTLTAFSVLLYISLTRGLQEELDRSLATEAQRVVNEIEVRGGRIVGTQALDLPPPGMIAVVYDLSGARVAVNDPRVTLPALVEALRQAGSGQQLFSTVPLAGADWRVLSTPVSLNGSLIGVLQIARSQENIAQAQRQLLTLLAVAVPLLLVLATALGLFLAGRALNPIDRIVRTADRIRGDAVSERIDIDPTPDEVGRLASTLNRMLDRIDATLERQRRFTADASHELRTPLAALSAEIELALERPRTLDEYQQTLRSVADDTARLNGLVRELLTLARVDAGQEILALESVSLDDLGEGVIETLAPLAEQRGVALSCDTAEQVEIVGDQTRLTQLFVNLVDNALKYTPAGGKVTLAIRREGSSAIIDVRDTGRGIPDRDVPHVFERFYRVDTGRARSEGGTGLGLAICEWIARAHGGEITVRSAEGKGSTFTVRLPLEAPTIAEKLPPELASPARL